MATQQYCLRWNNHQPNFISVFSSLLNSESLVDVTLAAEGRHLQAHKVVLSACSSYFQSLFTINPCQHPIVILKDVKFLDLKVMVDFMYYGEVNVSQEQLPHILKTAEMLKIKGLAEIPVEQQTLSKQQSSGAERTDHPPPADPNSNETHHRQSLSPSPCPPSPLSKRKRLRKTSTGSGSGSAEKADEHAPEAATSVIRSEGYSEPKHVEPDPAQYTPQPEFRASPKQPNDESLATTGIPETYEGTWGPCDAQFAPAPPPPPAAASAEPKRRSKNPQGEENFVRALDAVRYGGIGFCKAARMYGVNNRTLWLEYRRRGYPNARPSIKNRKLEEVKAEPPPPPPPPKYDDDFEPHGNALLALGLVNSNQYYEPKQVEYAQLLMQPAQLKKEIDLQAIATNEYHSTVNFDHIN